MNWCLRFSEYVNYPVVTNMGLYIIYVLLSHTELQISKPFKSNTYKDRTQPSIRFF